MADVIKKATRESYGEGLVELLQDYPDLVVLDADLAAAYDKMKGQFEEETGVKL